MTTDKSVLVVGGTGPTGPYVLQGLLDRGFDVTIYHRGTHEPPDLPDVRHLHGDPHFRDQIDADLGMSDFDVVIAAYGRTRHLAESFAGRSDQFLAVGGPPRYRGFYEPESVVPTGLPVPVREDGDLVRNIPSDAALPVRFGQQIVATEDAVFAAIPSATYFIYPYVYGPRNIVPVERSVIKRVLDGRQEILLPDGGVAIHSRGASKNLAQFLLLAVDQQQAAAGQVFNCGDDVQLTLRQWVELVLVAMNADVEIVPVPAEIAPAFRAIYIPNSRHLAAHCILDTSKAKSLLHYADVIAPADAIAESVEWYLAHPLQGPEPSTLADHFDYALEDALIASWRQTVRDLLVEFPQGLDEESHPMPHPKQANLRADEKAR